MLMTQIAITIAKKMLARLVPKFESLAGHGMPPLQLEWFHSSLESGGELQNMFPQYYRVGGVRQRHIPQGHRQGVATRTLNPKP